MKKDTLVRALSAMGEKLKEAAKEQGETGLFTHLLACHTAALAEAIETEEEKEEDK
jgi:hypothetical protein